MSATGATVPAPPCRCDIHVEDQRMRRSEQRTWWVVALTGAAMMVEIVVGYVSGSLALLADGWHMASHFGALGFSALAYWYARTRAKRGTFGFGTGKVYALAGYTNAIALGLIALLMIGEAVARLINPAPILYMQALPVAIAGLVINALSAVLLRPGHDHDHGHGEGHDHNLAAAYFHVLADILTSLLAIVALTAGYYLGWAFLDPAMGLVGAAIILRWGIGLSRGAARQLLDVVPDAALADRIRRELEGMGEEVEVTDLHLWEIAPGRHGCVASIVASEPQDVTRYREALLSRVPLAHLTLEICTPRPSLGER